MPNKAWTKGVSGNPNGRPRGSKNRLPRLVVSRVLEVWDELEKTRGLKGIGGDGLPKDKSLSSLAKYDPAWFYTNFIKQLLPKNIDIGVFTDGISSEEDLSSLPDDLLLELIKDNLKKKPVRKRPMKKAKARVVKIGHK